MMYAPHCLLFIAQRQHLPQKGVGAFRAPLVLQTLVCHYAKTASAVSCPQINAYPHGALTLATTAVSLHPVLALKHIDGQFM